MPTARDISIGQTAPPPSDRTGRFGRPTRRLDRALLFDLLMKHSKDGINLCEFDPRTGRRRLVFANAQYVRMSGHSRAALKQTRDLNVLTQLVAATPTGRRSPTHRQWYQCILTGIPFSGISAWKQARGRFCRYNWTAIPFQQDGRHFILGIDRDDTKQHEAETALKSSEEKYRLIAHNIADLVVELDMDGRVLTYTPALTMLLGYKQKEILGHHFSEFAHPAERSQVIHFWSAVAREKLRADAEFRARQRDGRWHWLNVRGFFYEPRAQPPRIVLVASDITARHQAEEAIRRSEEKFAMIFNSSPDMIAISTRADGRYVAINRMYERVTGYTFNDVSGKSHLDLAIWGNPSDRLRALNELRRKGRVSDMVVSCRTRSGVMVWLSVSAEPITIAGQECILWVGRDISERQHAEKALETSEHRYRLLTESIHDLVLEMDTNGILLSASKNSQNHIGWTPRQLAGRQFNDLIHPDDAKSFLRRLRAAAMNKGHASCEYRLLHHNGTWLWMDIRFAAVRTADGAIRITAVLKDETHRKKMELERQQLIWMLIHAQEKERQSISAALHDDLGQLLTLAKMQINSINAPDANSAHLLKEAIQNLDRSAESIRTLAHSLHPPLLNDLGLSAAMSMLTDQIQRLPGIQCKFTSRGQEHALAQPEQVCLYRILQEALSNASRHSKASRITVTLSTGARRVSLRIRDNGKGFDTTGRALEHGIGLRGMRERLVHLGGRLLINSSRNQGTVLTAILPIRTPSTTDKKKLSPP